VNRRWALSMSLLATVSFLLRPVLIQYIDFDLDPPILNGNAISINRAALPAFFLASLSEKAYVIGSRDVLWVTGQDRPDLTGSVHVDVYGMMSMPLIGKVRADGLTIEQLKKLLVQRLKTVIVSPDVDVQPVKIRFYVTR
jgi:protein involved in polysaccharide export with SLBB domain